MNQPQLKRHILTIEESNFKKTIILEEATYSIGRHSSNDIIIAVQKISRHHATLLRRTDIKTNNYSYWILDGDLQGNRSRNGIYINGKKCLVHELKDGDEIKFSRDIQAKYQIKSESIKSEIIDDDFAIEVEAQPQTDKEQTIFNKQTVVTPQREILIANSSEILRFSSFAELSPQAIIEISFDGRLIYTNSTASLIFKQEEQNHPLLLGLISHCNRENISFTREVRVKNNYYQQVSYYLADYQLIRSYITDITREKIIEAQIEEQTKQYKTIFDNSFCGIIIVSSNDRKIIDINSLACKTLGATELELVNNYIEDFVLNKEELSELLQTIVAEERDYTGSIVLKTRNGNLINTELEIKLINSDIKPKFCFTLKKENSVSFTLPKDKVSSLPRLNVFKKQMEAAISSADRNQKLLAVLALKINSFDNVSNAITREQRIILLSSFSERLKACLRFGDKVAYNGEDNFSVLTEEIGTIQEVAKISQRILDSLQQIFKIGEQQLRISGSIGISVYPQDGDNPEALLSNAGLALERSLEEENGSYQFYNSTMNSQNSVMLKLESFLHNALERDEFVLHYQPQINVNNGNIQGVEALLRWQHPELGLVAPTSFINLAEQTGLIVPIGQWVLKTACQQNKLWYSQGFPPLRVSVNLSPLQFQQPDLPLVINKILQETQLKPNLLELEVAASTVIYNLEYSHHILSKLQEIGVHISIDDFTTGYASWEKLKQIPFDTLKINRDFVRQLKNDPQDLAIISAMVALGRGFNLRVVAEGVETLQQIELLKSQECEQMQGFWFSRPLAAEEATKLLPFDYVE